MKASFTGDDRVAVSDGYFADLHRTQQSMHGDGMAMLDSRLQSLVQAMASFAPQSGGPLTVPHDFRSSVNTLMAVDWH